MAESREKSPRGLIRHKDDNPICLDKKVIFVIHINMNRYISKYRKYILIKAEYNSFGIQKKKKGKKKQCFLVKEELVGFLKNNF